MKKLLTILTAGLLLTSCSKLTPYNELLVLDVIVYTNNAIIVLDGIAFPLDDKSRVKLNRDEYKTIELRCLGECKVKVNGGYYFVSVKLK